MQNTDLKSDTRDAYRRLAPIYRLLENVVFGEKLSLSRQFGLESIGEGSRVLIPGGGDGRVLEHLPDCHVDFVESSESMLARAAKVKSPARITFHHLPFEQFHSGHLYDHVICQYFFDLFSESQLEKIIRQISGISTPETRLHVSDFQINESDNKWWKKRLTSLMYQFFKLATRLKNKELPNIQRVLESEGYELIHSNTWMNGYISAGIWKR